MRYRFRAVTAVGTVAVCLVGTTMTSSVQTTALAAPKVSTHASMSCVRNSSMCTEVYDSEAVFGKDVYVGHDEPATLFYSNTPGSGNRMKYQLTLPSDPPTSSAKSYNFQLHPAFWFGMAMCDTQSYPLQKPTCTPNSDTNITTAANFKDHAGSAFMEMQFYPPGWVPWPSGNSCDPTKWCAALNIFSLAQDPIAGTTLNTTCTSFIGGSPEYGNFAFITRNGEPQAPPNPVDATTDTFAPNPSKDLFMNSGDRIELTMHDTSNGLLIRLDDRTTGQTGSMVTSASNGFGHIQYDPKGTSCNNIPYDFHPMYSTSSELTRVPWAAHSYNIAFTDEIGHWDYCSAIHAQTATCVGTEGAPKDKEPAEGSALDDNFCLPGTQSLLVRLNGCTDSNLGFDGTSYVKDWPDGSSTHPTPIQFTSPLTGERYSRNYSRAAFEADIPRIEADAPQACQRFLAKPNPGANCTLIPITDDGSAASFYPFFSIHNSGGQGDRALAADRQGQCGWLLGNDVPGLTTTDFGKNAQYGSLLALEYLNVGTPGTNFRYNDYRQVLNTNPCPAGNGG
jgi:hypothetical protein